MKRILFVNDNEVLARLSREILQMEGYQAVPAYSADPGAENSIARISMLWSPTLAFSK